MATYGTRTRGSPEWQSRTRSTRLTQFTSSMEIIRLKITPPDFLRIFRQKIPHINTKLVFQMYKLYENNVHSTDGDCDGVLWSVHCNALQNHAWWNQSESRATRLLLLGSTVSCSGMPLSLPIAVLLGKYWHNHQVLNPQVLLNPEILPGLPWWPWLSLQAVWEVWDSICKRLTSAYQTIWAEKSKPVKIPDQSETCLSEPGISVNGQSLRDDVITVLVWVFKWFIQLKKEEMFLSP